MSAGDTHGQVRVTPDPVRHRLIVTCACGQSYAVPTPAMTSIAAQLQRAQHAHATGSGWTCAAGCHTGDAADFDHYLDVNHIPLDRAGEAFADYLNLTYGWHGQVQRVDLDATE
jgi:hypothetical protein